MTQDIIIIGAGLNGLAAALALGGQCLPRPLRVLLLDNRDPRGAKGDSRGTALTQATQNMFKALGVWPTLAPDVAEMRDILVTDADGGHDARPTLLSFHTEAGQEAAACMVKNETLHQALLAAVDASPQIRLQTGFAFASAEAGPGRVTVTSSSGESHKASLLVAADGRNSPVREHLGLPTHAHDYGQVALSFSIAHSNPHDHVAEEHFSSDGVFAVLPLPGNTCSIVWGTFPETANAMMALDEAAFAAALQGRMGQRLGTIELLGKRGSFPLVMQIAETFIASRVALLGDAAHAIHPLAGLGLNLGFKDAASLADCVAEAVARGSDIGGLAVLERYQTARRFDTVATTLAMDAMNGLFVNDNPVLRPLRATALRVVNNVPWVKSVLMRQAAGMADGNPRLMQGLLPG